MRDEIPEPLPRAWLPEPTPSLEADAAHGEARVRRLLAAAQPALNRLRAREVRWWETLAARWQPALAGGLAAAALVVLFALARTRPGAAGTADRSDPLLAVAVDAIGPLGAAGPDADPLLALVAWEGPAR